MEALLTIIYVWLFLLKMLKADMYETSLDVFNEMSDLQNWCPYSSFCEKNFTSKFPASDDYTPCCKSCSCDDECGLRGDCCFQQLDIYKIKETNNMLCVSTVLADQTIRRAPHFRMINKCLNTDLEAASSGTFCGQNQSSFHPVSSPDTGFIYYNQGCAQCNNVEQIITWPTAVSCPADTDESLPEFINNFISGNTSIFETGCLAYYIPPPDVSVASEACDPHVIRTCNTTGKMKTRENYWKFCEMFNGTYMYIESISIMYGNIYCYLCNVLEDKTMIHLIVEKMCPSQNSDFPYVRKMSNFPLTVILDAASVEQYANSRREKDHNVCPENSILVSSFQMACRPLKCPWGQIRLNNRCGYYSTKWVGGPFAAMLRLSPAKRGVLIPLSFFTDMPVHDKSDTKASWLNRKTLSRWNFQILYHHTPDEAFVDYIVVKATYPSSSVNPNVLKKLLEKALGDIWLLHYANSTIALKVDLNEHNIYNFVDLEGMVNSTQDKGFCPQALICLSLSGLTKFCTKEFIIPVLHVREELNEGVFVTRMFFCDQVDLLPNEYSYECLTVYFKVKNTKLHTFSKITDKKLTALEKLSQYVDTFKIRVCVDEFQRISDVATVNTVQFVGSIIIIFMVIYYL